MSQEDYIKRIDKLQRSSPKYITKPLEFQELFLNLLNEGVEKDYISKEFSDKKKLQLYKFMSTPNRLKDKLKNKLIKIKEKITSTENREKGG